MFRSVLAVGITALAAAVLSGCSLLPALPSAPTSAPDEGQTVAEACTAILPVILDTGSRMQEAYASIEANPATASPLLHDISFDLHTVTDDLENEEVIDVMTAAVDSLDAMLVELDKAIAGDPDRTALLQAGAQVEHDFSAIDPVCQAG